MKNVFLTTISLFAFAALSFGQISGTAHDMSGAAWQPVGAVNKVCGSCHTPHNAVSTLVPLWSHATTAVAAYTTYTSVTMDATLGQPDASSKACLSCHDGTVAANNFVPNNLTTYTISGAALVGTDLSNDHPISFTYDAALATADGGLYDPTTTNSGLGGTIDADLLLGGKMQCASCHDVHDDTFGKFQRMSNANSELCLTCHNK